MKTIIASTVIALSVSASVLIASSGGIDTSEKMQPVVENSVSIVPEGQEYTVDLSSCKLQKTVSIRHALEEVAIDTHEPGGLDADDDVNLDGLDDEYNYIAVYVSGEQNEAIRTAILDGSFKNNSKSVLKGLDIDPAQKVTVCDDDHDLD